MKFYYLANIRLPTEKAHGLQIMQMCEAFAAAGADLTLVVPRRVNSPEMTTIGDPWVYYGVERNFTIWRIACLDLFRWLPKAEWIAFSIQTITYLILLAGIMLCRRADVYYSRDPITLFVFSVFKPRRSLIYEAHQLSKSRLGSALQRLCLRRVGAVIAVTGKLGDALKAHGALNLVIAHDGIRTKRFENLPDRDEVRASLTIPIQAFVVGYTGQLQTLSMSKGIDVLIEAVARLPDLAITLCLVGGPVVIADSLRAHWIKLGLPAERFMFLGQVMPTVVPFCLAAFDVCVMPSPRTEFFAYYASPLKLFEYMASGKAILSSDLPAVAEVLRDGETGLLFPPGDVGALADAIRRLYDDPALRQRLGAVAKREAAQYSWQARAKRILQVVRNAK
jgi:glycosyltransferase involved in cell wall biosynthesis